MKRAIIGLMTIAVCMMMVVPNAAAGKQKQVNKYSTMTYELVAGPTQGVWNAGGTNAWTADGGQVSLYNVPAQVSTAKASHDGTEVNYVTWPAHKEFFLMFSQIPTKNGAPSWLAPKDLAVGTYPCPGNIISDMHFYVKLDGWGASGTVQLTAYLDCSRLVGQTVLIKVTANQLIISGSDITFNYYDYHTEFIGGPPTKYGSTTHDFVVTIDI